MQPLRGPNIDAAAYTSKNLCNAALYEIRQTFIHDGKYLNYGEMDKYMQSHEAYKTLPSKVAHQVLRLLEKNWKSFFEAVKAYKETPSKFKAQPRLPAYKHKTQERNICPRYQELKSEEWPQVVNWFNGQIERARGRADNKKGTIL